LRRLGPLVHVELGVLSQGPFRPFRRRAHERVSY
jgi:hypothetical protein